MYSFIILCIFPFAAISIPLSETENEIQDERPIDLSHLGEAVYGKPSAETGEKVKEWNETSDANPEELGEYAEGDILFQPENARNGLRAQTARWPNGRIPYVYGSYFSAKDKALIEKAMQIYHNKTCIKFVPKTFFDSDYVSIVSSNSGCWSSIGRVGGRQEVNLQSPGCLTKIGTALHELMHAVGFLHEQNRWERDNHVTIEWKNIQSGREGNFDKAKEEKTDAFGVPYDYGSVMHYSASAFSKNGKNTITPKVEGVHMGQRDGFSDYDLMKIRKMYKCDL